VERPVRGVLAQLRTEWTVIRNGHWPAFIPGNPSTSFSNLLGWPCFNAGMKVGICFSRTKERKLIDCVFYGTERVRSSLLGVLVICSRIKERTLVSIAHY
jgi:hypothetical protein